MHDRHRRRLACAAVTGCLVTAGAVAALIDTGAGRSAPPKSLPLSTAIVTETDLVSRLSYRGLLTYAARETVHPAGAGTITALPRVGQILARGSAAWSVDEVPVGVLLGTTPIFRTLQIPDTTGTTLAVRSAQAQLLAAQAALVAAAEPRRGASSAAQAASVAEAQVNVADARVRLGAAEQSLGRARTPEQGADVALVSANMRALGYADALTDTWGPSLQTAVSRWHQDLGAVADGAISPSGVIVLPGPARVGAVQGQVGDPTSEVSVSLTSQDRVATFQVRGGVPPALSVGRRVRIFAAGHAASGRVQSVLGGHGADTVVVAFGQASAVARASSTRATMSITTADRRDVLVVPVQSLVALSSGGYALQLPDGHLIGVRTGAEQDEQIEISGTGIHAGLRVVSVT